MSFLDILLIIVCGAGLMHGLVISVYLLFLKRKRTLSNTLLALFLLVLALRVGKSVLLIYASDLEFTIILIGLSMLLILGPVFFFYILSMTVPDYVYRRKYLLHFTPFLVMFVFSFFLTEQWFLDNGIFWSYILLAFIYGHFAFYIFKFWLIIPKAYNSHTKPQRLIIKWLKYLVIGVSVIEFSYVLNIFEDQVPYIIGPMIYSISIYFLTYKAFRLNVINYNGSVFKEEKEKVTLFNKIDHSIQSEKLYLDSNLNLDKVSELTSITSHQISSIINEQTGHNFNNYINQFRITEAKQLLRADVSQRFTISSIAYDVGFNSLSSFNSAFKKFENTTPSKFRNALNND